MWGWAAPALPKPSWVDRGTTFSRAVREHPQSTVLPGRAASVDAPISAIAVTYPEGCVRMAGWDVRWLTAFFISLTVVVLLKRSFVTICVRRAASARQFMASQFFEEPGADDDPNRQSESRRSLRRRTGRRC